MLEKLKRLSKEQYGIILLVIVALQPFLDLDYLFYNTFDSLGIPLLSTIVRLVFVPLMILVSFLLFEENKKKALLLWGGFLSVVALYFVAHVYFVSDLDLFLPPRYYFSVVAEAMYIYTILVPVVLVYIFNLYDLKYKHLKIMVVTLFLTISVPIF